jgi:purine-cytosine permease-like protein
MKWLVIGLFLLGCVLIFLGTAAHREGKSADEKSASAFFDIGGLACFALCVVVLIAWGFARLMFS